METYYITAEITRPPTPTDDLPPVPGAQALAGRMKAVIEAETWQDAMETGKRLIPGCLKKGAQAINFGWIPVKDAVTMGDDHIYQGYPTATWLTYYRIQAGLTQKQLSDLSGVNVRQIQRVESGDSAAGNLTAKNLLAIADALGVDPRGLI